MRNAHPRYTCFPSVVCVGKETEVTVFPRDLSRYFREDWEYELCVFGLHDNITDYHAKMPMDHPFRIEDGCMKFTHTFEREQEYKIHFAVKGDKVFTEERKLSLYAVEEDLYALRPLKGDLHGHTYWSDGRDGLAVTPADYREVFPGNRQPFAAMFAADIAITLIDNGMSIRIFGDNFLNTTGSGFLNGFAGMRGLVEIFAGLAIAVIVIVRIGFAV